MRLRSVHLLALASIVLVPAVASAHVIVTPAQGDVGQELVFSTSVPNEKTTAVTALRLVIPTGVVQVSPSVKTGWTIATKMDGDNVTEIDWSGGTIPVGQRDDFTFGAQLPANATTLPWKAYQTYADGSVVSWDQTPNGSDSDAFTPYSTTKVIDDLTAAKSTTTPSADNTRSNFALGLGIVAVILAGLSLAAKRAKE